MVHLPTPGRDLGFFSTREVRPPLHPSLSASRVIQFPRHAYTTAPNVAGGFRLLHLSHAAPGLRANLVGSDITPTKFNITIETWDQAVLYEAEAQWIEHKFGSRECVFGQFDTRDVEVYPGAGREEGRQEWSRRCWFPRGFVREGKEVPEVVCWLNRLDIDTSGGGGEKGRQANFRIKAYVTGLRADSAAFHIDTWGDCVLNGAALCWIAFPKGKRKVDSGDFSTSDVRPWHEARARNSARVEFKKGWFERPPTVLVALNMFDMAGNADLRVRVDAQDVDREGFTWRLDTWDDSTLYAAGASWIALGFE